MKNLTKAIITKTYLMFDEKFFLENNLEYHAVI